MHRKTLLFNIFIFPLNFGKKPCECRAGHHFSDRLMSTRRALHTSALWDCAHGGRRGHMISNLFFMNANVYSMFLYTYPWFHARLSLCSLFFTSYWAHWQSTKSTGFSSVSCPHICDSLFGKNRWVVICVFWGGAPTKRNLLSFCHDENEADCPTAWDLLFKRLNHEKKLRVKRCQEKSQVLGCYLVPKRQFSNVYILRRLRASVLTSQLLYFFQGVAWYSTQVRLGSYLY